MRLVAHLVRKDLRAAGSVTLIWIALMAIEVVAAAFAGRLARHFGGEPPSGFELLLGVLPYVESVVIALIASAVIHEDPLVDARAFWLTRPIPRGQLFAAKLITIATIVLAPALIGFAILFARYDVPPLDMIRAGLEIAVLSAAVPLLMLTFAATLTPSLPHFVLLLIGGFLALAFRAAFDSDSPVRPLIDPLDYADPAADVLVTLFVAIGFVAAIHQSYRRRDWRAGLAGCVLIFLMAPWIFRHWPGYRFFERPGQATGAWTDPSITRLRLLDDRQFVTVDKRYPRELLNVSAPIVLDGLPDGYVTMPFTLSAQLTRRDGTVLRTSRSPAMVVDAQGDHPSSQSFRAIDGSSVDGPTRWRVWPTLLALQSGHRVPAGRMAGEALADQAPAGNARDGHASADDAAYYSGAFAGTFRYEILRQEKLAALPLEPGRAYADGPRRVAVVEAYELDGLCRVTIEASRIRLTVANPRGPGATYYFADRRTGVELPATEKDHNHDWVGPLNEGLISAYTFSSQLAQWDVEHQRDGSAGDGSRCADTNLIFVRNTSVGTLTRSITLPDFRLRSLRSSPR